MKVLTAVLTVLLMSCLCAARVCAQEYAYDDTLSSLLGASGIEDALDAADLEELWENTDLSDPSALTKLSVTDVFTKIADEFRNQLKAPLQMLALLLGVIMLTSLAAGLQGEGSTAGTYEVVCVLSAVSIAVDPLCQTMQAAASSLSQTSDFMLTFSGIFSGVLAAGGGMTLSAAYRSILTVLCELGMEAASKVLFPMLSMCMAMSIVDAVNPAVSLEGVIRMLQKIIVWIMGLLMAVFLGLLSVQGMVAASADRVGTKATKYVISGAVPFVGGAVSDAYATLIGSMGVLRSATGMLGVLAVTSLLLPVLVRLFLCRVVVSAAAVAAELFGSQRLTRMLRNFGHVMSAGFSAAVSFSVMFVVSTAMTVLISGGSTAV